MSGGKDEVGREGAAAIVHLDLKGLKCPLPALKARKALDGLAPGVLLVVECTDPMAVIDLPHLTQETGDTFEGKEMADGVLTFRIRRTRR